MTAKRKKGKKDVTIFISVCCDRHQDDEIKVFCKLKDAINECKKFMGDRSSKDWEFCESDEWQHYHTAVCGDYSVRVETSTLKFCGKPRPKKEVV